MVAEWLNTYVGFERVLKEIITRYPEPLVDFVPDEQRGFLQGRKPTVSFIQGFPLASRYFRHCFPVMPLAIKQLDLSLYDVMLSNSHAVTKGVITGPHQLHVSDVDFPMRYDWVLQHQYLKESGLDQGFIQSLRQWQQLTSNRVDLFQTNYRFIEKRIWRHYRREAAVIPPPSDTQGFTLHKENDDFYSTAPRLVPFKRMDVIVEAFSKIPKKPVIVIGDGPEFQKIKKKSGGNVTLLGYQPLEILADRFRTKFKARVDQAINEWSRDLLVQKTLKPL